MSALRALHEDMLRIIEIIWVGPELHHRSVAAALASRRRGISLVAVSFPPISGSTSAIVAPTDSRPTLTPTWNAESPIMRGLWSGGGCCEVDDVAGFSAEFHCY